MAETRYRVTNMCRYDIGVTLPNQQNIVIKAGSFQLLTADEIVYIESICKRTKYFAKRMLVPFDGEGNEVPFIQMGSFLEQDPNPHMSDKEIKDALHQTVKKIEAWLSGIEDPAEIASIVEVAKSMDDLPANKLKLVAAKAPHADILS